MSHDRVPTDFRKGKLSATSQVVELAGQALPASLTLNSTSGTRAIEISTDGVSFFTASYDVNTAPVLVLRITAPVMAVRFTGAVGDSWSVV